LGDRFLVALHGFSKPLLGEFFGVLVMSTRAGFGFSVMGKERKRKGSLGLYDRRIHCLFDGGFVRWENSNKKNKNNRGLSRKSSRVMKYSIPNLLARTLSLISKSFCVWVFVFK